LSFKMQRKASRASWLPSLHTFSRLPPFSLAEYLQLCHIRASYDLLAISTTLDTESGTESDTESDLFGVEQSFEYNETPAYGPLAPVQRFGLQLQTAENTSEFKRAPVPYHLEDVALCIPPDWTLPGALLDRLPKKVKRAIDKVRFTASVIFTSNLEMAALHVERENADWNLPGEPYYASISNTKSQPGDLPVAQLISAKLGGEPQYHPEMHGWALRLALGSKWMLVAAPKRYRLQSRFVKKLLNNLVLDDALHIYVLGWLAERNLEASAWLRENEKMCYSWYMLEDDIGDWGGSLCENGVQKWAEEVERNLGGPQW
jgi:hypothetical protein